MSLRDEIYLMVTEKRQQRNISHAMRVIASSACPHVLVRPSPGRPPLRARQRRLKPALFFRGTLY